jgi:hypothetical protein
MNLFVCGKVDYVVDEPQGHNIPVEIKGFVQNVEYN